MTRFRAAALVILIALLSATVGIAPTYAAGTATISGTVRAADATLVTDSSAFRVDIYSTSGGFLASGQVHKTSGAFTSTSFVTQPVTIRVYYVGDRPDVYMFSWLGSVASQATATVFPVLDGVNAIDLSLPRAGTISGTVHVEGTGDFGSIDLVVSGPSGMTNVTFGTVTEANPDFQIGPFHPGTYTLSFESGGMWENKPTSVSVPAFGADVEANVTLERAAAIEGSVAVAGLVAISGSTAYVYLTGPTGDDWTRFATVGSDGTYRFLGVEPGQYRVCLRASVTTNWKPECVKNGASDRVFTVTGNDVFTDADISTVQWGGIQGTLESSLYAARLYRETPGGYVYVGRSDTVGVDYEYRFGSIEPGTYVVEYYDTTGMRSREYWQDRRYFAEADEITVLPGASVSLGPTQLDPRTYDRERLAGPDRFSTAVAISQELFPGSAPDVPVIYIANGLNYPDALSAGPAAAHEGGGLLLVTPTSIPAVIAAELDRLNPDKIVVVGGAPAVSDSVKAALGAYSSEVIRIGGVDRYETSRKIAQYAWAGETSDEAFIATGLDFPDALGAAPAAGVRGAPIVLVYGPAASLDTPTRTLLTSLDVQAVHIVGSSAAVSAGIESGVRSLVGSDSYVRYAGFNRFATAVLVSMGTFGVADYAFVSTGFGFADALAGGPLAASLGSPLYLSDGTCLFDYVMQDIEAVGANKVYLLGSTAVLSNNVYNLGTCATTSSGEAASDLFRLPDGVSR